MTKCFIVTIKICGFCRYQRVHGGGGILLPEVRKHWRRVHLQVRPEVLLKGARPEDLQEEWPAVYPMAHLHQQVLHQENHHRRLWDESHVPGKDEMKHCNSTTFLDSFCGSAGIDSSGQGFCLQIIGRSFSQLQISKFLYFFFFFGHAQDSKCIRFFRAVNSTTQNTFN